MTTRLIAVDLDGTLLNSRWQVSEVNRQAMRKAHASGVHVVCVTGRRFTFAQPVTSCFEFPHFLITNAGALTRASNGDHVFRHPLPADLARRLIHFMDGFLQWMFLIFDTVGPREVLCQDPEIANPHVARYLKLNESYLTRVRDLLSAPEKNLVQITMIGDLEPMRQAARFADTFPERSLLNIQRTEYPERNLALVDIIDGRVNKGRALQQLAGRLGLGSEHVLAIGDNHNDMDMLQFAGKPVVMKNAADALKHFGWDETAGNDDDGVAKAIQRFIFSESLSQTPPQ